MYPGNGGHQSSSSAPAHRDPRAKNTSRRRSRAEDFSRFDHLLVPLSSGLELGAQQVIPHPPPDRRGRVAYFSKERRCPIRVSGSYQHRGKKPGAHRLLWQIAMRLLRRRQGLGEISHRQIGLGHREMRVNLVRAISSAFSPSCSASSYSRRTRGEQSRSRAR